MEFRFFEMSSDDICWDCGMSWNDPAHATWEPVCIECGEPSGEVQCAEDHTEFICAGCSK